MARHAKKQQDYQQPAQQAYQQQTQAYQQPAQQAYAQDAAQPAQAYQQPAPQLAQQGFQQLTQPGYQQQMRKRKPFDVGGLLLFLFTLAGLGLFGWACSKRQGSVMLGEGDLSPKLLWNMVRAELLYMAESPTSCVFLAGIVLLVVEICALISKAVGRPNPLLGAQLVRRKGDNYGDAPHSGLARTLLIIVAYVAHRIVFVNKTCIELVGEPMKDWSTVWRWDNPFIFFSKYTAFAGFLADVGVKACLIMGVVILVLFALRSDAIPWFFGRAVVASSQVGLIVLLAYGLATFLSAHSGGNFADTGLKKVNFLGFVITSLPFVMSLLAGVIVIGTLMGGFAGDSYGGGGGYSGGGGGGYEGSDDGYSGGWQTGQIVHDNDGHTGYVRREGGFVYISRDDGTEDAFYGSDIDGQSSFTSSSGHHYWG